MNYLASGAIGLTFASCIYMQAYNASIDMLHNMEKMMDGAAAQLNLDAGSVPSSSNASVVRQAQQQMF